MSENEWLDIFSQNLEDIMEEKGYTQQNLADDSGLSKASISRYINAQRMPTVKAIISMAYVLDLSIDEFIDFGDKID